MFYCEFYKTFRNTFLQNTFWQLLFYIINAEIIVASFGKLFTNGSQISDKPTEAVDRTCSAVLENFAKFTGKHLYQSFFFNKVEGLRPVTLFKKRLRQSCFPVHLAKFLRTPFIIEHLWWLLLTFSRNFILMESF